MIRSIRLCSVFLAIMALGGILLAGAAQVPRPFAGFAPRVALEIQRHAHSVVADDVNEDGHPDLIVAVAGANAVAVFLGHGDGSFGEARYWPVGTSPKFAATGDFNHDGHRDIVTADQDSNTISVLLGNGDGTFRARTWYPACKGTHEVAVADFNRDGNDDVVVACHGKPYSASVFFGNGDGTFRPRVDLTPGDEPGAVVVGDFNGDGIPDLAFANRSGNTVSILLSHGDGTFAAPVAFPTGDSPHAIRAGDLNGDGLLDLVTANDGADSVTVLFGTGDGKFAKRLDLPANSIPKSVGIGDLNGDGRPDIVVANTSYPTCCTYAGSTVGVFLNNGDGTFAPRQDFEVGGNPFSLLIRDLNGDGKADIATANFIDQTSAQAVYLRTIHSLRIPPRLAKMLVAGIALFVGLAVISAGWRRARVISIIAGAVFAALLLTALWSVTKPRTEGASHVSILFGR
jgi:hypothetical protein